MRYDEADVPLEREAGIAIASAVIEWTEALIEP